jgi:hypothetical protein
MANEPPRESSGPPGAGAPADIPTTAGSDGQDDRIRERAYLIWVDEGRPNGREVDHWLRAKWELNP